MPDLTEFVNKKFHVLKYLSERDATTTTYDDICSEIHLNRHYVVKIIGELEEGKYIRKIAKSRYLITSAGQEVLNQIDH